MAGDACRGGCAASYAALCLRVTAICGTAEVVTLGGTSVPCATALAVSCVGGAAVAAILWGEVSAVRIARQLVAPIAFGIFVALISMLGSYAYQGAARMAMSVAAGVALVIALRAFVADVRNDARKP